MSTENAHPMISISRKEYDELVTSKAQLDLILAVSDKDNYSADKIIDAIKAARSNNAAVAVATAPAAESDEE